MERTESNGRITWREALTTFATKDEVNDLKAEMRGVKRSLNTLALSISGSAIVFAFSVLLLVGQ